MTETEADTRANRIDPVLRDAGVADSLLLKRWLFGFSEELSAWSKEEVGVEMEDTKK